MCSNIFILGEQFNGLSSNKPVHVILNYYTCPTDKENVC